MRRLIYILTLMMIISCHEEETIKVEIDVVLHSGDNHTSPLVVSLENNTRNAEEYLWTFEGGEPATSNQKDPGRVTFTTPGEHTVTHEAWNIGDRASKSFTEQVDSAVTVDFKAEK